MVRIVLVGVLLVAAVSCTRIPVGYRGVVVRLWGDRRGVDPTPLSVGRHWFSPIGKELHKFPVYRRNYVWEGDRGIAFQSMDGASINAAIGITYEIDAKQVVQIFEKFARGINEITNVYLRNVVMDAFNNVASEMPVEAVFGKGRVKLVDRVNELVIARAKKEGIIVDHIYAVGDFRVPRKVVEAINAKIEARQRAQQRENEIPEARAEALKAEAVATGQAHVLMLRAKAESDAVLLRAKADADAGNIRADARARQTRIQAEADADATRARAKAESEGNALVQKTLTPPLIELERVRRWNGTVPVLSGAGNALPILHLDKLLGGSQAK